MASNSDTQKRRRRRDLLIGLAALGAVGGGWQLWLRRPKPLEFSDIEGLPGWRQVAFGGVTTPPGGLSGVAFAGLDESESDGAKLAPEALCEVLFQTPTDSRVTVAAFSDFYCPYCKVLTARLAARDDIAVTWHELPLLGPASEVAARAAVAAARQGGYVAFQTRLTAAQFRPTRRFLADTADALGLSAQQLLADMNSEDVAQTLAQSRRASRTLGIWGTPAVAVGRTLVIGAIDDAALSALIAEEAGRGSC